MIAIELPHDPYDAGRAHGKACGDAIRAFVRDDLGRVSALRSSPIDPQHALSLAEAHAKIVFRDTPAIAEEVCGLARGAGISEAEAFLLQFRREIAASERRLGHGCSLLTTVLDGDLPTVSQTIDLEGDVASLVRVFRTEGRRNSRPRMLTVSLAGLVGYVGMNDRGLCIGINMVLAAGWKPGVSPYILVRHLLSLANLDDCLQEIHRVQRSSSRSLVLLQGHRCVNVEMTPETVRITEGIPFTHTNHFLHPDLVPLDQLGPFSKASSRRRLLYLDQLVKGGRLRSTEDIFESLSDHSMFPVGICMHSQGIATRADTVAAVSMQPERGTLYVRHGHPCTSRTEVFVL